MFSIATRVKSEGALKWTSCSDFIPGRNGKQCRERWFNTLSPNVVKGNWTEEEDYNIFSLFQKYGAKWCKLVRFFRGRTENSIKNRFYSTLRKTQLEINKNCETQSDSKFSVNTGLNILLDYLPIVLNEKASQLAKINNCEINELEDYEIKFNKKLNNNGDNVGNSKVQVSKNIESQTATSTLQTINQQTQPQPQPQINIANYNPIFNMSFNISKNEDLSPKFQNQVQNIVKTYEENTFNSSMRDQIKKVNNTPSLESNLKNMPLLEIEKNIQLTFIQT